MTHACTTRLILSRGAFFAIALALSACAAQQQADGDDSAMEQSFAERVDYTITGIEPGAGIMINTEKALEEYGLEEAGWNLKESSSAAMMAALQDASESGEPIVATVWEPHALFAAMDIRKLDDPKGIYNSPEQTRQFLEEYASEWSDIDVQSDVLATVTYDGFAEDAPAAAQLFESFTIPTDIESDWIHQYSVEGEDPETIAAQYVEANADTIKQWKPASGIPRGVRELTIGIPPWPGEAVKSRVLGDILEQMGYTVEIVEMDIGPMYSALSTGDIDVTIGGWLPTTHQEYWNRFSDDLVIAGINGERTWLGLGVPAHVDEDIQSISDLIP